MEGTGWNCPRCGSEVQRFDQWFGCKLKCVGCGYMVEGFFARYYLKISNYIHGVVSV